MSTRDISAKGASTAAEVETPRFSREVTLLTMLSVLLVMLLASLDQTIVGTAMPRVIAQLNGSSNYTWVTTAYLLTSTVMVPIYGKLSDLYGRKWIMIFSLSVFLVGSALSGASQDMTQLILFRGFQGIGAGGLMSMAIAIIGDLFTPRERAKWQGVTGAVFGIAFILGPTAGGWITDNLSWRWVFYVNLPLGVIALLVLIFLMPMLQSPVKNAKIDFLGALLLILGVVPLLLGFSWAGSQYDWASPQILGLFGSTVVALVAFVLYEMHLERTNGQPIVEPSLFRNNVFTVSTLVVMLSGAALIGSISFIPLFVQGVVGTSATNSGVLLTPLMMTAIVSSILSGILVGRFGKYKAIALIGGAIAVVGSVTMLRLGVNSTNQDVVWSMLILGLGIGASMSLYNLIVQNAFPTKIGQASAAMTFFRQIGSTIGLAAMGSVLNSSYATAFHNALPAGASQVPSAALAPFSNPLILLNPGAIVQVKAGFAAQGPQGVQLFNTIIAAVREGVASSLHDIFFMSVIVSVASLLFVVFLKEIPLRGGRSKDVVVALNSEALPAASENELVATM